jgi:hypothetical protein
MKQPIRKSHFNMDLLRPDMTFREFSERAWEIPEIYLKSRYSCLAHDIGMVYEYRSIAHRVDWEAVAMTASLKSA